LRHAKTGESREGGEISWSSLGKAETETTGDAGIDQLQGTWEHGKTRSFRGKGRGGGVEEEALSPPRESAAKKKKKPPKKPGILGTSHLDRGWKRPAGGLKIRVPKSLIRLAKSWLLEAYREKKD